MSERMTSVTVRVAGFGSGVAEYGRRTRVEMISMLRKKAARDKREAEQILAAADEDFIVETYVGVYAHKNLEVVEA